MIEDNDINMPLANDDNPQYNNDFLKLAKDANESGDFLLSMYLYLAAFQKVSKSSDTPNEEAILGLKQAWSLACNNNQRSMAEYIFELLEPYLSNEELNVCAEQLQNLAFDKLAEIGLSRDDLEEMAEMISDELMNAENNFEAETLLENLASMVPGASISKPDSDEAKPAGAFRSFNPDPVDGALQDSLAFDPSKFNYSKLAGYSNSISCMQDMGIGTSAEPEHVELIEMLNSRHGLSISPSIDSLLFRADAREDANRFMLATVGELNLPAIHMRMEEGFQNSPILCISTYNIEISSPASLKNAFASGGVLVLENLDLWESPSLEMNEEINPLLMMQMTRGAREAINLIRSAVDSPEVYVIATASVEGIIDDFFLDLLDPMMVIDISLPDEADRQEIWMEISKNHPSFRQINKNDLVKYSANMTRFDIYMAAREAVEEAYKAGLAAKKYVPITRDNLFDKLACYHPLESDEYSGLENAVVKDFQDDLEHIDDLLDGN